MACGGEVAFLQRPMMITDDISSLFGAVDED